MRQKLNLLTLGVKSIERATDFYEKGLGWERSSASQGDIILYNLGGMILALYPRKLLAEDATINPEGSGFKGISFSFNAKNEEEVDAVIKEVESHGATVVKPAQKVFWGGYSGYFKDLDGHLIEVAYNPFWQLDANDNVILPD